MKVLAWYIYPKFIYIYNFKYRMYFIDIKMIEYLQYMYLSGRKKEVISIQHSFKLYNEG